MTRSQASYLDHLCRRAGIPYDPGLNVAEAHQLITALAEGGRIGASTYTHAPHIGDRPAGPGMNPSEFARHRVEGSRRSGREPMTAPQKALLSRLCQRTGVPYDASLDSAQASERIASLMSASPAQRQPAAAPPAQRQPAAAPPAQRRPAEAPEPYLGGEAEEAIAAAERRTGERRGRPADRLRTAAEIMESERLRTAAEIMASERVRTAAEIQADEDRHSATSREHEAARDAEQEQRLEWALRPWWWR